MNIIEIITLNKHGDFQEVIFSSLMSYLLNPSADHGLNQLFLNKLVNEAFAGVDVNWPEKVNANSEYSLGNGGRIDLFVEIAKKVIAIEVKIWDQSAKNESEAGISQLERYCDFLSKSYVSADWRFIYLVPTFDSPKCLVEFGKVYSKDYRDNLKILAWNPANEESLIDSKFPRNAFIEKSVLTMISEILENKEIKRVNIPLNTLWLLDSLQEFIPNLLQNVPETVKFPITADLEHNPATWKLFDKFFTVAKRWPSPILTTVGVPYGVGENKVEKHKNSLYRIRTTKDYYTRKEDKFKNLPQDTVELELWPDVYDEIKPELLVWLEKLNLDKRAISETKHIDSYKREKMMLISINKNVALSENDVSDFNAILRNGFDKLISPSIKQS